MKLPRKARLRGVAAGTAGIILIVAAGIATKALIDDKSASPAKSASVAVPLKRPTPSASPPAVATPAPVPSPITAPIDSATLVNTGVYLNNKGAYELEMFIQRNGTKFGGQTIYKGSVLIYSLDGSAAGKKRTLQRIKAWARSINGLHPHPTEYEVKIKPAKCSLAELFAVRRAVHAAFPPSGIYAGDSLKVDGGEISVGVRAITPAVEKFKARYGARVSFHIDLSPPIVVGPGFQQAPANTERERSESGLSGLRTSVTVRSRDVGDISG